MPLRDDSSSIPEVISVRNSVASLANFAKDAAASITAVPRKSPFQEWNREELEMILIDQNIQIRKSGDVLRDYLVRLCDDVFEGVPVPDKPSTQYSPEKYRQMQHAALVIQGLVLRSMKKDIKDVSMISHDSKMGDCFFPDLSAGLSGSRNDIGTDDISIKICEARVRDSTEIEWRKPSWKSAKRYGFDNQPNPKGPGSTFNWRSITLGRHCIRGGCGEQLDLWDEGQTSEFAQFGSGVTNYFKFVKWCCWVMAILFIINVPMIILNSFGKSAQYGSSPIALTTMGNLGSAGNVTSIQIPGCEDENFQQDTCSITKSSLALLYSELDALGVVFIILAWLWLRHFERIEETSLSQSIVSASDYTLRVANVPNNATESELAAHFEMVTGEEVAEVHLAFDNAAEIGLVFKRGSAVQKRFDCVQRIRYEKTMGRKYGPGVMDKAYLERLSKKTDCLRQKIKALDIQREANNVRHCNSIEAYVTFESEYGFVTAMSAYQLSWLRSLLCFYPDGLKFSGRNLKVTQAAEPSTIIWENLEYSSRSRFFRKCLTTGVATLAILASMLLTFFSRGVQQKALEEAATPCPGGFDSFTLEEQIDFVSKSPKFNHCYCETMSVADQGDDPLCTQFLVNKMKSVTVRYGASAMVCATNTFLTLLLEKAGSFEKHPNLDQMEESIMFRVFFLWLINTGFTVLLYDHKWLQTTANKHAAFGPIFGVSWYGTGGESLIIVMSMNIFVPHITSLLQYWIFRRNIDQLEQTLNEMDETDDILRVWYSQDDLNKVYLGPQFQLNYRYAQTLLTFYVCWMYSTAIPIMPLICALSCYVSFWIDKFLFCNFYRTPPSYSYNMGKTSTKLIEIAVVVHLVMSLWILGNGMIFTTNRTSEVSRDNALSSEEGKFYLLRLLSQTHLIPLEIILLGYIGLRILSMVSTKSGSILLNCVRCLTCSSGEFVISNLAARTNTVQATYSSAKDRNLIKGLASYNILQNPKYQEAFGISSDFAEKHRRLSSIKGLNTKDFRLRRNISQSSFSVDDCNIAASV